jgi:uncharacterized protein
MTAFVDSSALYALLDADDSANARAAKAFTTLRRSGEALVTHSYVAVETIALVHRRLGWSGLDALLTDLLPLVDIRWVSEDLHQEALVAMRTARSRISLVDHMSFALMRREVIGTAFAFDDDFAKQGFTLVE